MERFSESDCSSCGLPVPVDLMPDGDLVRYADAQAAIAALQADIKTKDSRIWELESWLQVKSPQEITLMESKIIQLEHQLTQRTAERDTARRRVDELEAREVDVVLLRDDLEQRTAECDALKLVNDTHMKTVMKLSHIVEQQTAELEAAQREARLQKEVEAALLSKVAEYEVELNGDPQNFYGRGRTVGLRTLVLALPKVEGEIVAQAGYVKDRKKVYACFGSDADMTAYAALLTHRQGMEG